MPRTTVGEELQELFRMFEAGQIPEAAFNMRKKALLDWSRCCLPRFAPKRLRAQNHI